MENYMRLEFPAKSSNESFARAAVSAFAAQMELTVEELSDIKTAVSEAVTNAIVHGYRDIKGIVELFCRIEDQNIIHITISDNGVGIDDVEKARQPLYTSYPDEERSGMGFTVMETFMDKVSVKSRIGEGTTVEMSKRIGMINDV